MICNDFGNSVYCDRFEHVEVFGFVIQRNSAGYCVVGL